MGLVFELPYCTYIYDACVHVCGRPFLASPVCTAPFFKRVAPDHVARSKLTKHLVSVDSEANVRRQANPRRSHIELAMRKAAFTQVDADATQRLALRLVDGWPCESRRWGTSVSGRPRGWQGRGGRRRRVLMAKATRTGNWRRDHL